MLLPFLFAPISVFAVTTSNLPSAEFADTEVSTNIAFAVERPAMTRIEFTVALDATPTNNVEVAIVDLDLLPRPHLSHTFILKRRQLDTAWNLVKVTRRGCGYACELVEAKGRKPGFRLEVR